MVKENLKVGGYMLNKMEEKRECEPFSESI
jgi:hypothetical protein